MIVTATALDVRALVVAARGRLLRGAADVVCPSVSIDSRTIPAGAMFVAYPGPRFDGHDFVRDALARGASAVVVEREAAVADLETGQVPIVLVANSERALQDMAQAVRRASGARVVAITGSAGKTTTKEAIGAVADARHRTLRNKGNLNNHLGLPMSLFDLQQGFEVAVVELGMNHAGEIRRLVEVAEPDIRVWTNVGTAHIGHFGTQEKIAAAKAEILEQATRDSVLVANGDDDLVMRYAPMFAGRVVTFGETSGADVRAAAVRERGVDGFECDVVTPRGDVTLSSVLIGRAHVSNLLAAVATGIELDVPLDEIARRLSTLSPARHRGEVIRLRGDIVVVDDSYNASPSAVERMLEACARGPRRRFVACLGEMLELGDQAQLLHGRVARAAHRAGVNEMIAVGGDAARHMADEAVRAGMPVSAVHLVDDSPEAAALARQIVRDGDLVLVKGSRGIRMEVVVDGLREGRG